MSDVIVTPALLRGWPLPTPDGDKHSRGTLLVVGGADGTPGAAILAGLAALRSGAGRLQICCGPGVAIPLAVHVPEALVVAWTDKARLDDLCGTADALVVGPGLDDIGHATELLRRTAAKAPEADLVVDAYGLGALSHSPDLLRDRPHPPVLTPNMTEAAILAGQDGVDDVTGTAHAIAQRYHAVVALRGLVVTPDGRRWRDEGGDVGLGTAGSGDVLAGLVAGLLARGAAPEQAACWATYLHAAAGQRLAARLGRTGFLARELVAEAPLALAALQT
jgi:ADP-dependent NAD(P)H-hydrate dehydratase